MLSLDFKNRLRQELVDRCKRNSSYSLRAFATHLELDPSTLSKILKGKRVIGKKSILQLGIRIGLTNEEIGAYLNGAGNDAEDSIEQLNFQQLKLDRFAVISDWYHFAILELMLVDEFRPDNLWIARALGIKPLEVDGAVDRLVRVGLLGKTIDGDWEDLSGGHTSSIGDDMVSAAHRRLQEQFLVKAADALTSVPIEDRDHSTMTMAVDRSRLPAAREKIKRFRRSLAKFLSEGDVHDEILNLNIALFPITKLNQRISK